MERNVENNFRILDLKETSKFHILPIYMPDTTKEGLKTVKTKIAWLLSKWDGKTPIVPIVMGNVAKDVTKAKTDDEDEENLSSLTPEMNAQINQGADLVKYLVEKFGKDKLILLNGQKEISFNEKSKADFWEEVCDEAQVSSSQCYVKLNDKLNLISYLRLRTSTQENKSQKVFSTIKFISGSKSKAATLNGAVNAIKKAGPLTLDVVTDFTIASNGLGTADGRLDKNLQVVDSISAKGRLPKFITIVVNSEKDISVSNGLDVIGDGKAAALIKKVEELKLRNKATCQALMEKLSAKLLEINKRLDNKLEKGLKVIAREERQSKKELEEVK